MTELGREVFRPLNFAQGPYIAPGALRLGGFAALGEQSDPDQQCDLSLRPLILLS